MQSDIVLAWFLAALALGIGPRPSPPLIGKLTADSLRLVAVTSGNNFTCGLAVYGAVWCWGANQYGQLGVEAVGDQCEVDFHADGPCSLRPVRVSGGLTFSSVEAGSEH